MLGNAARTMRQSRAGICQGDASLLVRVYNAEKNP